MTGAGKKLYDKDDQNHSEPPSGNNKFVRRDFHSSNKKITIMTSTILEVSATMRVRKGQLEGFKQQASEIIKLAKERDTKTLRYDWFLSNDETECEVRELYESSEGLIEHRMHIVEALKKLFSEFAEGHAVKIYGELSPKLKEMLEGIKDVDIKRYTFLNGLESEAAPEWQSLKA